MQLAPRLESAVKAYEGGESAAAIQARLGVSQDLLYRVLQKKGKRGASSMHWCLMCGDDLTKRQKSYCSRKCHREYAEDLAKEGMVPCALPGCGSPVNRHKRKFCGHDHHLAWLDQRRRDSENLNRRGIGLDGIELWFRIGADTVRQHYERKNAG